MVCEISLRFQLPNTIPTHFHSFKIITKRPSYYPFSYHLPKLILLFLLKKVMGTNIFKIWIENYVRGKKEPQMIQVRPLKIRRREVKEDPKLGGQWKVPLLSGQWKVPLLSGQWNLPSLMANGRFHYLVANGMFQCLVANGRFHCLVANGRWRKNTFSLLPTFPPTNFT